MSATGIGLSVCGATLVVAFGLARLARSWQWVDRRDGAQERKPRVGPVPLVGGAALLAGLAVYAFLGGPGAELVPWTAVGAAFLLGFLDDLLPGGLRPAPKFAGQVLVAWVYALTQSPGERLTAALWVIVAQNAVNTFDNVDGAAPALGLVALFPHLGARAVLLGVLPANLLYRRAGGERLPYAYLGDSGTHVLGVLCVAIPGALPALWLPLLDFARLAVVRIARGRAPWDGDRLHLAHRFEAAGFPAWAVAWVLAAMAALPVAILGRDPDIRGALLGGASVLIALALAVRFTPDPLERGSGGGLPLP